MKKGWNYAIDRRVVDQQKLKVALVNPSMPGEMECAGNFEVYPHIGIVQIATYIRDQLRSILYGWEIDIEVLDQNISERPLVDVLEKADIVGVSMISATADEGLSILKDAKAKGALTVAGNDHATMFAHTLLQRNPELDFVLKGDYVEKPFRDLILKLIGPTVSAGDLSTIPSLSFGVKNIIGRVLGVAHNHPVPYPMDDISSADLTLIPDSDKERYVNAYRKKFGVFHEDSSVVTPTILNIAQGCDRSKNPCVFCGIQDLSLRHKSPDKVFEEIKTAYELGYNYFYVIADDLTSFSETLLKELCARWRDELGEIADKIKFFVYAKADSLVSLELEPIEAVWEYFRTMNVHRVNVGFESGDKIMLKRSIGKSATVCQNGRVVGLLKERGIQLHTSMVVGAMGETEESLKNSLAFVECILEDSVKDDGNNNIVEIDISVLMPVLGSKAWRIMTEPVFARAEINRLNQRGPERKVKIADRTLKLLAEKWTGVSAIDPDELAQDWIKTFTHVSCRTVFRYIKKMREAAAKYKVLTGGSF